MHDFTEVNRRLSRGQGSRRSSKCPPHLHEAAEAEDGEVEAAIAQELLRAGLDEHQGDLRMALRVVNAEEHKALDAHGLRAKAHATPLQGCLRLVTPKVLTQK
jgi:hypothetical protein